MLKYPRQGMKTKNSSLWVAGSETGGRTYGDCVFMITDIISVKSFQNYLTWSSLYFRKGRCHYYQKYPTGNFSMTSSASSRLRLHTWISQRRSLGTNFFLSISWKLVRHMAFRGSVTFSAFSQTTGSVCQHTQVSRAWVSVLYRPSHHSRPKSANHLRLLLFRA